MFSKEFKKTTKLQNTAWVQEDAVPKADIDITKWVKCDECKQIFYKEDIHENNSVCPNCNKHFRLSARRRLTQIIDERYF